MTPEFFQRHKTGLLLSAYLVFSSIFLTNRVDPYIQGIKSSIWFLVSPQVVYTGQFFNRLDALKGRIFGLVRTEGENKILRDQLIILAQKGLESETLQEENQRLRKLLGLKEKKFAAAIPAEVVGRDVRDWFHSVILNKGLKDHIPLYGAVVGGSPSRPALVGRIVEVDENSSKVLLITDPVSAVSVQVIPTEDLGLMEGWRRPSVVVRYLSNRSKVEKTQEVVTVGLGGVFPPGIPVGRVGSIKDTADGFFKEATVIPYIDLGSLREVLVLARPEQKPTGDLK